MNIAVIGIGGVGDYFGGTIAKMGKQYNIKVETTRLIYDSIQQNKQI